jgi:hypothetical protein
VQKVNPWESKLGKTGRRGRGRAAECDTFPWNRQLDFKAARANAAWDDGIYEQDTLNRMAAVRLHNKPIVDRMESKGAESMRKRAAAKRAGDSLLTNGTGPAFISPKPHEIEEKSKPKRGRKKKVPDVSPTMNETNLNDQYHSGNFSFATPGDEEAAKKLACKTPDDVMNASRDGEISLEECAKIQICWNPGKRGSLDGLVQAQFSIKDTIVTKLQLQTRPILTKTATERIIDFCPDLLFRGMLLRMASEAGLENKELRDRLCCNGCFVDKATITKRITAALGQKQLLQDKRTGEEDEWYIENTKHFENYCAFFGKHTKHRSQLTLKLKKSKASAAHAAAKLESSRKDIESSDDAVVTESSTLETSEEKGAAQEKNNEVSDAGDAVSAQDSDVLDAMED